MKNLIVYIFFIFPLFAQLDKNKEKNDWVFSTSYSHSFVAGKSFSNYPNGVSVSFSPPIGFDIGPFYYNISIAYGNFKNNLFEYPKYNDLWPGNKLIMKFDVPFLLFGGNINFFEKINTEIQIGQIGEGFGLKSLLGLNIPKIEKDFKVKFGTEFFLGQNFTGNGNPTYIINFFFRIDILLNNLKIKLRSSNDERY
tara:strand:+ start:1283 stop:1870 length:588 start_codon:yes stop_codon:yes gene_type:complete